MFISTCIMIAATVTAATAAGMHINNEEERREEYERLQGLSEKELLIEIVLLLEEIKHRQFLYSD